MHLCPCISESQTLQGNSLRSPQTSLLSLLECGWLLEKKKKKVRNSKPNWLQQKRECVRAFKSQRGLVQGPNSGEHGPLSLSQLCFLRTKAIPRQALLSRSRSDRVPSGTLCLMHVQQQRPNPLPQSFKQRLQHCLQCSPFCGRQKG